MPQIHRERPAGALARGNTKSSDIEIVRRDLRRAEESAAKQLQAAAARHRHDVARRERGAGDERAQRRP
jgi:hypothetical protein